MQHLAAAWVALELVGSPLAAAAVWAARTLPIVVLSIPAGIVADRFDRRLIMLGSTLTGATASATLAILAVYGALDLRWLLVISLVGGVANAMEIPSFTTYVGQLAGRHLPTAIALNGVAFNVARVVGPAIGGMLLATSGAAVVFAVNAASYLAFAAVLVSLRGVRRPARSAVVIGFRAATRLIGRDARLVLLLALLAVHTLATLMSLTLAVPFALDLELGASGAGAMMAAGGAGAIVALALVAGRATQPGRGKRLLVGGLVCAAGQWSLSMSDTLPAAMVTMAVAIGGMVAVTSMSNATLQMICPPELRGRLMGLYALVVPGLAPFAALGAGAVADRIGVAMTLQIGALAWAAAIVLVALAAAPFRQLDGRALELPRLD